MRKRLLKRIAAARDTAARTSATLWLDQVVPVEMCIKQGAIIRQWNELEALLGGQGS